MKLLLINGPNINLTGRREPAIYGYTTLKDIEQKCVETAAELGAELQCMQSNHEGVIIDAIQEAMGLFDGIVINPGALTHYSYSLRDALAACDMPFAEIHMSNIYAREPFRAVSVIDDISSIRVIGEGHEGYYRAVRELIGLISAETANR